jgi:hypothetical protein
MSESVPAPPPRQQPNLARKFPLTDMPTGLMAALATRLADRLPVRLVVDELPFSNFAPSRTRATRWGALTARQWAWAACAAAVLCGLQPVR